MFGALTDKLQSLFRTLAGKKVLTEENLSEAMREVRLALLEADVSFPLAGAFVKRVKEKAVGADLFKSVSPSEQFVKLVHDELTTFMGGAEAELDLKGKLNVIMLAGLQGAGKTTTAAKLAHYIVRKEKHKKVMLAACDLQRPAAVEQLKRLGSEIAVPVFSGTGSPVTVAKEALEEAKKQGIDVLIVDTAGRLHVDAPLMQELQEMKELLQPREVLFVASAQTGQDAVKVATEFHQATPVTGFILTMLDGNARAGAAISIREATGQPLKFEGIGEKVGDLQLFHPKSMADRILGMGDIVNLVKRAQEVYTEEENSELEKKFLKAAFTYDDYLKQMGMIKKMGSMKGILKMLPGMSGLQDLDLPEKEFKKLEAMILSMTQKEREERVDLSHNRKKRIASGSGVSLDDVNRMVKGFQKMKDLAKQLPAMKAKMGKFGLGQMNELKTKLEGFKWR
jgi:signal recognition particle subunit SRP54